MNKPDYEEIRHWSMLGGDGCHECHVMARAEMLEKVGLNVTELRTISAFK